MISIWDILLFFKKLFLFILFPLPSFDSAEKRLLATYNSERSQFRSTLLNSTYQSGYGNVTGFRLSYGDALEHRNVSLYPFPDRDYEHFLEDEKYSILPNTVSQKATDIWDKGENTKLRSDQNYVRNITATFRGTFEKSKHNFTEIDMPLAEYLKPYLDEAPFRFDGEDGNEEAGDSDDYGVDAAGKKANAVADGTGFSEDMAADSFYGDVEVLDYLGNTGNVSDIKAGKLSLEVLAQKNEENLTSTNIIPISVVLRVSDFDELSFHMLQLHGLYFPDTGNMFMATKSGKFQSTYALPHMMLNENNFDKVKEYMINKNKYYVEIDKKTNEDHLNYTFGMMKQEVKQSTKCEYLSYLHINPVNLTKHQLQMIEDEVDNHIGRPTLKIPEFVIDKGLFYSPDCGILLEFDNAVGISKTVQIARLRKVVIVSALLFFLQLYLLIRQMNQTNTPPRLLRLSSYTISLLNLVDGTSTVILVFTTVIYMHLYPPVMIFGFFAFILSFVFEIRYMISICLLQLNEGFVDIWTALRGNPSEGAGPVGGTANNNNNNENNTENPELPTTRPPPAFQNQRPAAATADDERAIVSNLYVKCFMYLLFGMFFVGSITSYDVASRRVAEKILLIIANSYWYPQIFRNIVRGSRSSFSWEFMIGTSIVRLIPVVYIYGVSDNVFHHHTHRGFILFLIGYISFSLAVIYIQERFGPRALIPRRYLPKIYNYHPVLSLNDLENSFGIDLVNDERKVSSNEHQQTYRWDCAICMNPVDINVEEQFDKKNQQHQHQYRLPYSDNDSNEEGNLLGKKAAVADSFMVTPCRHIFHNDCLESWMRYKLQCPVCRNPLPPI